MNKGIYKKFSTKEKINIITKYYRMKTAFPKLKWIQAEEYLGVKSSTLQRWIKQSQKDQLTIEKKEKKDKRLHPKKSLFANPVTVSQEIVESQSNVSLLLANVCKQLNTVQIMVTKLFVAFEKELSNMSNDEITEIVTNIFTKAYINAKETNDRRK